MTKHPVMVRARERLAEATQGYQPPPFYPLNVSPWVAAAVLQKSIRRGRKQAALRSAARLLQISPEKLWRRLGCVAFEDIGVADTELLSLVLAALTGKRFRESIGGEWAVAAYLVCGLVGATKCRAADDLLMAAETHPGFSKARSTLPTFSAERLLEIATGPGPLHIRALAAWFAAGTTRWRSRHLPSRSGNANALFDAMLQSGMTEEPVEIAREGWRKLGEALCPFFALLTPISPAERRDATDDHLPPEVYLGDLPGWSLDQHSREGRRALQRFSEGSSQTATWVRAHISPRQRISFLGGIVFRTEGGLLRSRLRWPLGDELRRLNDLECAGVGCPDASEVLALMRADIPELNRVRAMVMEG